MEKKLMIAKLNMQVNRFRSYFPVSEDLRKRHLDYIRNLVKEYQPKIEERVGFALGEIKVKENSRLFTPSSVCMSYNDNVIYVNFNKRLNYSFLNNFSVYFQDPCVIHEISHCVWQNLSKPLNEYVQPSNLKKYWDLVCLENTWNEGFATYCEKKYFKDFLSGVFDLPNFQSTPCGVYEKGLKKINKVIEKHGEQILLEIPRRFIDLEQEIIKPSLEEIK
jgi:hypothetical protein